MSPFSANRRESVAALGERRLIRHIRRWLGVFVVAFFIKWVKGSAVFYGAIAAQATVLGIFFLGKAQPEWEIGYLWLNPIGCAACVLFSVVLQAAIGGGETGGSETRRNES